MTNSNKDLQEFIENSFAKYIPNVFENAKYYWRRALKKVSKEKVNKVLTHAISLFQQIKSLSSNMRILINLNTDSGRT